MTDKPTHLVVNPAYAGDFLSGLGQWACPVDWNPEHEPSSEVNLTEYEATDADIIQCGTQLPAERVSCDFDRDPVDKFVILNIGETRQKIPLSRGIYTIPNGRDQGVFGYKYEGEFLFLAKTSVGYTLFIPINDTQKYLAIMYQEYRVDLDMLAEAINEVENTSPKIRRSGRRTKEPARYGDWEHNQ